MVPGESLKSLDWAATAHRRRFLLEDAALGVQDGQGIGAVVVCQFLSGWSGDRRGGGLPVSVVSLLGNGDGLLGLGR